MKTYRHPQTQQPYSSIVLGLMRITNLSDGEIQKLVGSALDAGVTVFDHADVYGGGAHQCESRFGDAIRLSAEDRARVTIQSKVGIRPGYFDFSAEHILRTVDESLAALKLEYLDVLMLHRPDTLVEPEEVAGAFEKLERAGKVLHFAVSNQKPPQIELLKTAVRQPILFNQVQLSLTHANLFAQGIAVNMEAFDQSVDRDIGLLDYSRAKGIMLQAWSPFQKRFFDGVFLGDRAAYPVLNDALDEIAAATGSTPAGIAVAWIVRHPANIQVVLGTTKPERIAEAAVGSDVVLTREQWYRLFRAAGHTLP